VIKRDQEKSTNVYMEGQMEYNTVIQIPAASSRAHASAARHLSLSNYPHWRRQMAFLALQRATPSVKGK
jgi:hypothetical protein